MPDHDQFIDRIAEYLSGGLPESERSQFESHVAGCESCAAELAAARQTEKTMTQLFAPIAPPADFEDRLIARMRLGARRLRISPAIRRAAVAASVAVVLGGFGYVMNQRIQDGNLPLLTKADSGSNSGDYWMGGHVQRVGGWSLTGRKITLTRGEESAGELNGFVAQSTQTNSPKDEGQNVLYGDGKVEFQKNPYDGVNRDMIYGKKSNSTKPGVVANTAGSLDIKKLQNSVEEQSKTESQTRNFYSAYRGEAAQQFYFKPAEPEQPTAVPTQLGSTQTPTRGLVALADEHAIQAQSTSATPIGNDQPPPQAHVALKIDQDGLADQLAKAQQDATKTEASSQSSPIQSPSTTQPTQKIIRNGEMEFVVDSFDSASATISKVVGEEGGAVVTVNSEKLANGKVKGVVTVRVPPDHLDTLVLKLRALGDLKRQNLTAEDVTKQYTDTASELRADHAMEERLLNIIKTSQGQVKDLLAAEKELAVWREKIEKAEGEIRYYDNLVAMSTLTIQLSERDISNAAAATESENVDMGVEADDVEAARADAIKAIDDAKGRIIESELKKLDAGQFAAKVVADIKPDAAGPAIDRLKQLGRVARLEMSRQQTTATGATPDATTKLVQGDTHLVLSLYNLANIAPRQTAILNMASDDVEQTYQGILARIAKAGGRVVTSNLNRQADQQTGGTIQCEVKSADADAVIADIRALGDVVRLNAVENPDTNNVTSAKRGISIELSSLASLMPREVNNRAIASADVVKSQQALLAALGPMKARVIMSKLDDAGENHLNGYLDFEVRRANVDAAEKALASIGETYERRVDTSADADNVTDAKVQFKVQIVQATSLPPRQTDTLAVEVRDVDSAAQRIQADAASLGGRVVDSSSSKDANAQTAKLTIEVPLSHAGEILSKARELGVVRTNQQSSNAQAPAGELARERLELTLASGEALVAPDQGILANVRHGLVISFTGLMWSLQLIVIGLCFVVPWAVLIWGVMRVIKRRKTVSAMGSV